MIPVTHARTNEDSIDGNHNCHLWLFRASLTAGSQDDNSAISVLSAEETLRAERLRSATRRREFEESRRGIRQILSAYLKTPPADVRLIALPSGRPVVLDSLGQEAVSISVSHTGGLVAIAIAPVEIAVGVDIEDPKNLINETAIRSSFFSEAERCLVDRCDVSVRRRLMLQIWTAKEAGFKAAGGGPGMSLMDFVLHGDADSLAFDTGPSVTQFCVAQDTVEAASCGSAPVGSIVGSFVSSRRQINASGTDAKYTACFAEVTENSEGILAAIGIEGVECRRSSVFDLQSIS